MEPCTDSEAIWFGVSGRKYVGTAQADNNRRDPMGMAKRTEAHPLKIVMNRIDLMLSLVKSNSKTFHT